MSKPRLLDLFSGAGGAARGYQEAGFHVTGVDLVASPRYAGDEFVQADAMTFPLDGYDAIHASPPCQAYGSLARMNAARGYPSKSPRLIGALRARLIAASVPYVIENVPSAPLLAPVQLCGSMFGLRVRRHRNFETPVLLLRPRCRHDGHEFVGVYGDHPKSRLDPRDGYARKPRASTLDDARDAMGIDWMTWNEIREAIPPAYTRYIGEQLVRYVETRAATPATP